MSEQRILVDAIVSDVQWRDATQVMLAEGWSLEQEADFYGRKLASLVIMRDDEQGQGSKGLSIEDIQMGLEWTGALRDEAEERSSGNRAGLGYADRLEASGRDLVHLAGESAIRLVGTEEAKQEFRTEYYRLRNQIGRTAGMGGFEKGDFEELGYVWY